METTDEAHKLKSHHLLRMAFFGKPRVSALQLTVYARHTGMVVELEEGKRLYRELWPTVPVDGYSWLELVPVGEVVIKSLDDNYYAVFDKDMRETEWLCQCAEEQQEAIKDAMVVLAERHGYTYVK